MVPAALDFDAIWNDAGTPARAMLSTAINTSGMPVE